MDLQAFIQESITQIINGIKAAQADPRNKDAVIVPLGFFTGDRSIVWAKAETRVTKIDFDVAVSAEEATQGGGKAALAVMGVGLSGGGGKETSSSSMSRISFQISIVLPGTKEQGMDEAL